MIFSNAFRAPRRPRVLFIVEPYPCRSGGLDFEVPFLHFLRQAFILQQSGLATCSIICSTELAKKYSPEIQTYSPDRAGISDTQPSNWPEEWESILKGSTSLAWIGFYKDIFDLAQPDVVYIWNMNETARRLATARGINVLFMEQGYLRSVSGRRTTIDPQNYGPLSLFRASLDSEKLKRPCPKGNAWASDHIVADVFDASIHGEGLKRSRKARICVLGQKDDDVNNVLFSNFSCQQEYFQTVTEALLQVPEIDITLRPHPLASSASEIKKIAEKSNIGFDTKGADIRHAIGGHDCFITVNSSAGFEAIACGRPTLVLGRAGYKAPRQEFTSASHIRDFVDTVKAGNYWTEDAVNFKSNMLDMYVSNFSIPSHFSGSGRINSEIQSLAMSSSQAGWRRSFTGQASLISKILQSSNQFYPEMESGAIRYLNFLQNSHNSETSKYITELQFENSIRISQLALLEAQEPRNPSRNSSDCGQDRQP
ncbi:hypothetical protein QTH87_01445 [Variovorax sp. J22P168]|uniref:capsular polysaccharide export protein, LipB/KpsS family n=1 Tax=Variovorax jilinensis TaxID=3053513 RepID=UPI0025757DF8|nr:hypothetical protein [Variovorax sp. J22P168]MDM0011090.1 hypothetical protein [Variovorax sp. J22P168]